MSDCNTERQISIDFSAFFHFLLLKEEEVCFINKAILLRKYDIYQMFYL